MMTVGRICTREVDLVDSDESVQAAAQRMHARNVGTLLVVDQDQKPIGIVTDRDLTVRVLAEGLEAATTRVRQVMTASPQSVTEDTPIESALSTMRSGPYRRLPVVDSAGRLVGLLSIDDVLDLLTEEFGEIRRLLERENPASLGKSPPPKTQG